MCFWWKGAVRLGLRSSLLKIKKPHALKSKLQRVRHPPVYSKQKQRVHRLPNPLLNAISYKWRGLQPQLHLICTLPWNCFAGQRPIELGIAGVARFGRLRYGLTQDMWLSDESSGPTL